MPKSVIERIAPLSWVPLGYMAAKASQGFGLHCLMPSEMRRRSRSISRIITSTAWLSETMRAGLGLREVQSISEACTRPSTPASISTKQP